MKVNKIKRSLISSILIIIILRLVFIFIPIYSSVTTLKIPGLYDNNDFPIGKYDGKKHCLDIRVNYDLLKNQTKFNFTSRSLEKQKSIECIKDGITHIENIIYIKNATYNKLLSESKDLNSKLDELINDFKSSKNLDKDKLILINDYFININKMRIINKFPLPLSYEIKTNTIKNDSLLRYLFSGFILTFWITYFIYNEFKI